MKKIVVIGGGVAGLGAAYKIRRAAEEGHDVSFTLVEKDDRLGGKIRTEHRDGFIIDAGCDSCMRMKPAVHRIAGLAGIEDQIMPTDDTRKKTVILKDGRLHVMPDGVMQFAPTKFWPFFTTGLFSWPGKVRAGMDLFVPKKKVPAGELNDETLEHFMLRRMGREILDRLAEPLVGGVHASDPAVMSLAATFPNLLQMEQDHGSMIRGFLAQRRKVEEMKKKYPPDPKNPKSMFMSFRQGFQQLTDTMADRAGRDEIRTGVKVLQVARSGDGWKVFLSDGEVLDTDAVVVTTEGWAASALVSNLDEQLGSDIGGIQHSSSATVSLAWDTDDLGIDLNAFGLLCPLIEKREMMAASYSSTKWPGRAPEGKAIMRGFVGGPHNQAVMENNDDALVEIVIREFRDIFGLKVDPTFAVVGRWTNGMPQYTLGHLDRVERIERRMAAIPGLGVGGGSYRGVGVPNCIDSGEAAARKVMAEWGIDMAEDHVEEKRRY